MTGGQGFGSLTTTEILQGGEWREGRELPSPRVGAGGALLGGTLVILGGLGGDSVREEILRFDPDTEDWRPYGRLDTPLYNHALTVVNFTDIANFCTKTPEHVAKVI